MQPLFKSATICILLTVAVFLLVSCKKHSAFNSQKLIGTWLAKGFVFEINDLSGKPTNFLMGTSSEGKFSMHFLRADDFTVELKGDSLHFLKSFIAKDDSTNTVQKSKIRFKVLKLTDSFLYLRFNPEDTYHSSDIKDSNSLVKLTRAEFSPFAKINLEKIIFHSSSCFGYCPVLDIEVDSNRTFRYKGRVYNNDKIDSEVSGNFGGAMSPRQYKKLLCLLQTAPIDSLDFGKDLCCDGSIITLIVYYNGKKKCLKSMNPPLYAKNIVDFFCRINSQEHMIRTKEEIELESYHVQGE